MGIIFTFIMGLFMSFEPITDNDWFWHYVIGHLIDTSKTIPTKAPFVWHGPYDWTSHEWITEWIMYKLGPIGCLIAMLIIFLLLYILMAKLLKVKFKKLFDFRLLYLLLMTIFFKVTGPRPYIISLLFMAYLVYVLFNYIDDEKKYGKLIFTIPVLQILWVNFHGGSSSLPYIFIIGVLMCHFFLKIFKFNEERWTGNILSSRQLKTLLIVLGLTLIGSCINPFGYKMILYPFTNMADTSMLDNIVEWASPSFHDTLGLYIFLIIAIPVFNMILTKQKMKLHEIGFQLVLFYMCLKSQRFIGMYGIYSMWTLGKYFFVSDNMYETFRKPFKKFEKIITIGFCVILVLAMGFVGYKQIKTFRTVGVIDNDGYYSDEAIKKVAELKPKKLYNDFGGGGYLLYRLDRLDLLKDVKIFSYGLGDVFSQEILPKSLDIGESRADTRKLIEHYDFDVMLTFKSNQLHYFLDEMEEYELYYQDDMCYIYVKK